MLCIFTSKVDQFIFWNCGLYFLCIHSLIPFSTPAGKYSQRKVAGRVVTSLNDAAIPSLWRGTEHEMVAKQLIPLKSSDQFMFQKVSEKAFGMYCVCVGGGGIAVKTQLNTCISNILAVSY